MLLGLQQFLPTICSISSEFIFQQNSAPAHTALDAINFPPMTLPNLDLFEKFFQDRLNSKFYNKVLMPSVVTRLRCGEMFYNLLLEIHCKVCWWKKHRSTFDKARGDIIVAPFSGHGVGLIVESEIQVVLLCVILNLMRREETDQWCIQNKTSLKCAKNHANWFWRFEDVSSQTQWPDVVT